MSDENIENKNLEIETGENDLEISPVYEHLNSAKPKTKEERENIIVPDEVKNENIEDILGVSHEDSEIKDEEIDLEVETGDGTDLVISPVYEHLNAAKPQPKEERKDIIIPKINE